MTGQNQDIEGGRLKQFWITWRGWVLLSLFFLAVVMVLALLGWTGIIETGLGEYAPDPNIEPSPERAKTLWDWMDLLLVPLVLALGAAFFTWVTNKRGREIEQERIKEQREIELDRSREAALQAYLDRMTELLEKGLRKGEPDDEKRHIARARTLTVLRQLDAERKGLLLRFLFESGLIDGEAIIELRGAILEGTFLVTARLSAADLKGADLKGANLSKADLGGAALTGAVLTGAVLSRAVLTGANLTNAYLGGAILSPADLRGADLTNADLTGAVLTGAVLSRTMVTDEQLAQAKTLEGATLRDGTKHTSEAEPEPAPPETETDDAEEPPDYSSDPDAGEANGV